jgi:hypothetical protein
MANSPIGVGVYTRPLEISALKTGLESSKAVRDCSERSMTICFSGGLCGTGCVGLGVGVGVGEGRGVGVAVGSATVGVGGTGVAVCATGGGTTGVNAASLGLVSGADGVC